MSPAAAAAFVAAAAVGWLGGRRTGARRRPQLAPLLYRAAHPPAAAASLRAAQAAAARPPPRRVLITNDDGPASPFFEAFVDYVEQRLGWPVFVCLPANNQSFVSKAITTGGAAVRRDHPHRPSWRLVEGSPATAVNLALHALAPDCDLVLSGPNVGHNAGAAAALSSGTIGAALEGALAGRRAVALSFPFVRGWNKWTPDEVAAAVAASAELTARLWQAWPAPHPAVGGNGTGGLATPGVAAPHVECYNINTPLGVGCTDGIAGPATGTSMAPEELDGAGGASEWCREIRLEGFRAVAVRETFFDTRAGYSSLFAVAAAEPAVAGPALGVPVDGAAGRGAAPAAPSDTTCTAGAASGDGDAPGEPGPAVGGVTRYTWAPAGLRSFESADVQPGSDVAAVRDGLVSVTPLMAAFQAPRGLP